MSRSYIIMSGTDAMRCLSEAEPIARKFFAARLPSTREALANALFRAIHDDTSVMDGSLSPMASLAHKAIAKRGRWDDPVQTACDIAQSVAIKIFERKLKWPKTLPFKVLVARVIICTALDAIKKQHRHFRKRWHDGPSATSHESTDLLSSVVDSNIIPEHAYTNLLAEVHSLIDRMTPLEQSVAHQRILNIQTVTGRQFARSHGKSPPWASHHYHLVSEAIELYILALELGICH